MMKNLLLKRKMDLQLFSDAEDVKESDEEETVDTPVEQEPTKSVDDILDSLDANDLLKHASVKTLVENARKQEKDKVYKSLSQKEEQLKSFKEQLEVLQNSLKEKENENLSEQELLQRELQNLRAEQESLRKEMRIKELYAYKEKRLREVRDEGDDLILDLVMGQSEEEIDVAVELSKAKYKEIEEKALAKIKQERPTIPPKVNNVTNPQDTNNQTSNLSDLMGDYGTNRERILKLINEGKLR